jgi:arylsulfatase A-like enzyme
MKLLFMLLVAVFFVSCSDEGQNSDKAHSTSSKSIQDKRPNILFVFADDWGCYSESYAKIEDHTPWNQVAETPNLDRIAKEGILFRNAHVNSPQCTPSRSALLSGQYFYRTGLAAIQDGIWDFTNPSFPMMLRDAGYHTGYTYKVWSPGTPRHAPFGGEEYKYERAGRAFNKFSQSAYKKIAEGMSVEDAKKVLYDQVQGNFDDFLADREEDKPFYYWFGATNPHREWIKGSGKKLWGIDPDDLKGKMPPFLPDVPEVREDLADYFGENRAFDGALGVLMEKLEEIGELENTLIVVSGDHGAPGFTYGKCNLYDFGTRVVLGIRWGKNPKNGRVVDDFVNLMDLAPTFLQAAGVAVPKVMTGNSLIPLLLSEKEGQIDPKRSWVVTGRERHVSTSRDGLLPYPQRSYRTKDYLYIINFKPDRWPVGNPYNLSEGNSPDAETLEHNTFITYSDMDGGPTKAFLVLNRDNPTYSDYYHRAFDKRPREELYDLRRDPNQMNNVAGEQAYADIQAELDTKLMKLLTETGDPRVLGDGSRFDKMPYIFKDWSYE